MNQPYYAGFNDRFAAYFIDGFVLAGIYIVFALVTALLGDIGEAIYNTLIIPWIGYEVIYQSKKGQTIGKRIMGLKVVTYDYQTPTIMTFLIRETIGKMISSIFYLGFITMLFDPKKQTWHDKIAKTYVVDIHSIPGNTSSTSSSSHTADAGQPGQSVPPVQA